MNSKFQETLMKYMMPIANRVEQQKHLQAIKDGMIAIIPIIIIGSISLLPLAVANLLGSGPVYDFLSKNMGIFTYAGKFSMDMLSVYAAFFIAAALAKSYGIYTHQIGVTAILIHLILSGLSIEGGLDISYLGASGLFTSIISSILSVEITRLMQKKKMIIRLPDSVPSMVGESFASLLPLVVNVIIAVAIANICLAASGLVGKPIAGSPGFLPPGVGAFIMTMDWKCVVLVFVNLLLMTLFYYPFFKAMEADELKKEQAGAA